MARKKKKRKVYSRFIGGQRIHIETSIEKKIRYLLRSMGISFEQEAEFRVGRIKRYYDFLCYSEEEGWNFVIEVHGSHWHSQEYHEGKLQFSKLNRYQKRNVKNDQLKEAILRKAGVPLVIVWEPDVNLRLRHVRGVIQGFVDQLRESRRIARQIHTELREEKNQLPPDQSDDQQSCPDRSEIEQGDSQQ